jgi:hypothetical protein
MVATAAPLKDPNRTRADVTLARILSHTQRLLADMLVEFPRFRLVPKSGDRLSRIIDQCLRIVTLGLQNRYLTEYHTVIGETLYLAPTWNGMDDPARYVLLCHERIHLRQRRRYGTLGMALLYLLPLLPLGLALGRARIEWEAYRETLRASAEMYGMAAVEQPALRAKIVERFTGPDYGWMWPFPRTVAEWYDCAVKELRRRPATGSKLLESEAAPKES